MIEVDEANIGNYTLEDVIFPILGHKVKMPSNPDMRKILEDLMKKDNMTMEQFQSHAGLAIVSATGSYRKIVGRATEVESSIDKVYNNSNEDLVTPNYLEEADPTPKKPDNEEDIQSVSKALRLRFSLRPSSYATMFLREVTRTSSAFHVQHQLSKDQNAK